MAAADASRARGRLRHRAGRHASRRRSAAARRRDLRPARRRAGAEGVLRASSPGRPSSPRPIAWGELDPADFDGLLLPGGHAPGMRQYLGSPVLRQKVAAFWALDRPVGAICHGVLVLARTSDPATGRSVLAGRRTTCLPKYMERGAYLLTAWRLGRYYRTYPAYVEDEVERRAGRPAPPVRARPADPVRARHRDRRLAPPSSVGGRQLPLGALARRRLPVRPPLLRAPDRRRHERANGGGQ